MASSIRSLTAWSVVVTFALSAAPSAFAGTGNAELPVTLTVYDICTLDTGATQPSVACSAGGQYRILAGEYFADVRIAEIKAAQRPQMPVVEIAF
ncbi:hypothetical protein [Caballeronia sp. GAWG1-1]|uniref:hypothetical protein n=1 Tax=Caballeronia sp. GAWG1-1 TaxID=2921742 RepID=UPI0020277D2C|nr:hypothetical protein [Caballeronia sp. GAWG1-1]